MSARPSSVFPCTCSGERYFAVPIMRSALVRSVSSFSLDFTPLAMPKSVSQISPLRTIMMFAGLMSRCTMPCAWTTASAEAIARPTCTVVYTLRVLALPALSPRRESSSSRRLWPLINCITSATRQPSSMQSYTGMMCG